jgi:hypothetical protein
MHAAYSPRCEALAIPMMMEINMRYRVIRGGAPPGKREGRPLTKRPPVVSSVAMNGRNTTRQAPRPSTVRL